MRAVRLEGTDMSRLGNLEWPTILQVDGLEQQHVVGLLGDSRRYRLHDLAVDGLLVVGDKVLVQQLLDLVG